MAVVIFVMLRYRVEHLMHLELQWSGFIPLTFWVVHRTVESVRWRDAMLAGLFVLASVPRVHLLRRVPCAYPPGFRAAALATAGTAVERDLHPKDECLRSGHGIASPAVPLALPRSVPSGRRTQDRRNHAVQRPTDKLLCYQRVEQALGVDRRPTGRQSCAYFQELLPWYSRRRASSIGPGATPQCTQSLWESVSSCPSG